MQYVNVYNSSRPEIAPVKITFCESFLCRLRGLTFRRKLEPDDGLLLVQKRDNRLDSAIHMLGVWFDLAIIWINSENLVVDTTLARSWRLSYVPNKPAMYVLELHPSRLNDFRIGDRVQIDEVH